MDSAYERGNGEENADLEGAETEQGKVNGANDTKEAHRDLS